MIATADLDTSLEEDSGTTAVEYAVDGDTLTPIWSDSDNLMGDILGSVQRLENGNTLPPSAEMVFAAENGPITADLYDAVAE